MINIQSCPLPADALLNLYSDSGAYADCYVTDVTRTVSHAEYVEAFYTTAVFKLERLILKWFVARPSTDDEVRQLAAGNRNTFAAWTVEARAADQLLLGDFSGRTKSWLMVATLPGAESSGTQLYFGSAVVPARKSGRGRAGLGLVFTALLGFHKLYSRILLWSAAARISRS